MSYDIEPTLLKVIRETAKVFRTYNAALPRRIVLSWTAWESLKGLAEIQTEYAVEPLDDEGNYESFRLHGIIVSRIRCTCGAL